MALAYSDWKSLKYTRILNSIYEVGSFIKRSQTFSYKVSKVSTTDETNVFNMEIHVKQENKTPARINVNTYYRLFKAHLS